MSFADRKVRVLGSREHYAADSALVVRQNTDDQETTLQIRRIVRSDFTEELQIEIGIVKQGKKRNTQAYSSFVVPVDIADKIVEACKVVRVKELKNA